MLNIIGRFQPPLPKLHLGSQTCALMVPLIGVSYMRCKSYASITPALGPLKRAFSNR